MKIVATILTLFIITVGCIKLPETGKSVLLLTSPGFENQLGDDGYKEVLANEKTNNDPRLNTILRRVGQRLAAQTGNRSFKWEYTLLESEEQNAWCMPGGKIAVYTGILPPMLNEAGLAAVLGHEIAHATLRHSGQRISQQMIMNTGLSLAEISLANTEQKDTVIGLMGAGATVGIILPYSRGHESEADLVGLKYMAKAGYDPREAPRFWERFKATSGGAPPEFLSTHPGSSHRIRDLTAALPEVMPLYERSKEKYGIGDRLLP